MDYEILLVNTVRNLNEISECFHDCIGQHLIAEYLRERDFKAKVFSGDVRQVVPVIEHEIMAHNVPVIGFYVAADNLIPTQNIIRWLKRHYPERVVLLGGVSAG